MAQEVETEVRLAEEERAEHAALAEGAPELAAAVLGEQVEVQGAELEGVGARHAALEGAEALVQLGLEALLGAL